MAQERRTSVRYQDRALVELSGGRRLSGRLSDLSVLGARAEFGETVSETAGAPLRMRVFPHRSTGMKSFSILVALVWRSASPASFEAGFRVLGSPDGTDFKRYVDYLAFRHAQTARSA